MTARDKAKIAYDALTDKKAYDVKVLDISNLSTVADYFVIAEGSNKSQLDALRGNVLEFMGKEDCHTKSVEGYSAGGWILLDYYDIIVHIFHQESRRFYDIERTWNDAKDVTKEFAN